jgi:hypothetical protein
MPFFMLANKKCCFIYFAEALHILVINLNTYQSTKESFKENVEAWIEWVTARLLKPRIMIVPTHCDECKGNEVSDKCKDILSRIQDYEKKEMKRLDDEIKKLKKKSCPDENRGINVKDELEKLKWLKKCRPVVSSRLLPTDNKVQSKVSMSLVICVIKFEKYMYVTLRIC